MTQQLEREYPYLTYTDKDEHANQLNRDTIVSNASMLLKTTLPNHIEFQPTNASQTIQFDDLVTLQLLNR